MENSVLYIKRFLGRLVAVSALVLMSLLGVEARDRGDEYENVMPYGSDVSHDGDVSQDDDDVSQDDVSHGDDVSQGNAMSLGNTIAQGNAMVQGMVQGNGKTRSLGPYTMYEQIVYQAKQEKILSWLADDMSQGRATGTHASKWVADYIVDKFEQYGVMPLFGNSYYQHFMVDSTLRGRNVAGIVRSNVPSDEYVIICAHYDHIGVLNGFVYNGADDNASGVTALLNIADMFGTMKKTATGPGKNIVFVALDAKEHNMAGSKYFVDSLTIPKKNIICAINIDQIGSVIEPVHDNDTNFVIALGEKTLAKSRRGQLDFCNNYFKIDLDVDHTFYGSKAFTDLYYQLSDQVSFRNAGIPAILFTSGFHRHTYKVSDDPCIISYPVLKKRTILIFYLALLL